MRFDFRRPHLDDGGDDEHDDEHGGERGEGLDFLHRTRRPMLEAEAKRIISLIPRITPGRIDGKVVEVPFSLPIIFKLQ